MGLHRCFLSIFFILFLFQLSAQERGFISQRLEKKDHIALVIGNASYPDAPLSTPGNDATDVSRVFREMGFVTDVILDANKEQMAMAIDQFAEKLRTAKAAVFYYAGHGMQVNGQNYLIPIGNSPSEQITTESQVPYRAVNVSEVLTAMEQAKVQFSMVVLDACRNNPLKGTARGKVPGLAAIDAPVGSLVMYATRAGDVAYDGENTRNSPFTTAFLEHIQIPGLEVSNLPVKITNTVSEKTEGRQIPGTYMQLTQDFTFVPAITAEEILAAKKGELNGLQIREAELERQQAIEDSIMTEKQTEIDVIDRQITQLKNKTGPGNNEGESDLDKMLAYVKEKEHQQKELNRLQREAEEKRVAREKELFEIKLMKYKERQEELDADLKKYFQIVKNEYGNKIAQSAWDVILSKWGLNKGSIAIDEVSSLKLKINPLLTFRDSRDGNIYKIVKIGSQWWMAENLAWLSNVNRAGPSSSTKPYYYVYNYRGENITKAKKTQNYKTYGVLYNWPAALSCCPDGWHLPSNKDWEKLAQYVNDEQGPYVKDVRGNWNILGKHLKSKGSTKDQDGLWIKNGGTDLYNFSGLPGGHRSFNEVFHGMGKFGCWWSSTEDSNSYKKGNAIYRKLEGNMFNSSNVYAGNKEFGFSVRCIKD